MNTSVAGRKVRMLRCHIYPTGVGPKPANALIPSTFGAEAYICTEAEVGVILKEKTGKEHVIPWSIIEHVELEAEENIKTSVQKGSGVTHKQLDIESKLKGL